MSNRTKKMDREEWVGNISNTISHSTQKVNGLSVLPCYQFVFPMGWGGRGGGGRVREGGWKGGWAGGEGARGEGRGRGKRILALTPEDNALGNLHNACVYLEYACI